MPMAVVYTTVNGVILSENRNGVKRDYVPDTLGSTAALVDRSGTISDRWEYWPYGEVQARMGTNVTPFTFVGTLGYFRDLSYAYYVRARMLTPRNARWLTVDPMWPAQFPYQYGAGEPTANLDPMGLEVFTGTAVVVGGLVVIGLGMAYLSYKCMESWAKGAPPLIDLGPGLIPRGVTEPKTSPNPSLNPNPKPGKDPWVWTKAPKKDCDEWQRRYNFYCGQFDWSDTCSDLDDCYTAIDKFHSFHQCAEYRKIYRNKCIHPNARNREHDWAIRHNEYKIGKCEDVIRKKCSGVHFGR